MSHPGKFVSVNLSRSYGQSTPSQHGGRPSSRPAGASSAGAGGGMVVLSRTRGTSVAKPQQPKLSVPPPLNLPSLRKEHERFDGAAAAAGGGVASAPPRSGVPAAGWTKPTPAPEKPPVSVPLPSGAVRPPAHGFPERAIVFRGEDFPSLKAAVAPPPPPTAQQRQKDGDVARAATPETRPMPLGMRPQVMPQRAAEPLASGVGAGAGVHASAGKAQEHDLGPLPLVRLRYDFDWADDERGTGLSIPERDSRERGFGRSEAMIPGRDIYGAVREPFKKEPFGRDLAATIKEGGQDGSWRSPVPGHNRERTDGQPYSAGRGSSGQSVHRESMSDGASKDVWNASREPALRSYGQNGTQLYGKSHVGEASGERYGDNSNNWFRGNHFPDNAGSRVQPFLGNKGPLASEPVAKFGREKRLAGSPVKPFIEDVSFGVNLSSIKKKKEASKPADFHDPVRESFEAELDRILRVQEQERQRVVEEQERVREIARKQEEERERLIREEEERRRLVEEDARQAAWQAEQETLEVARKAEEQRIAREEEKRRVAMEEERRREAARQKLVELEARIARRRAESNMSNGNLTSAANDELAPGSLKDIDVSQPTNAGERQNINIMGEHINTSASSGSSSLNRYSDTVPRVHILGDGHSSLVDREHAYHSARSSLQDQENLHYSPRRDTSAARRGSFLKKDSYDGFGALSVRPSSGRTNDSPWALEDYRIGRVPRWDAPRENDFDSEFFNSDRYGDAAWLPSSSHESPNAQQGDRIFENSEANDFSTFARSRYSMRQPHVPPSPIVTSVHGSAIGASSQRTNSSFLDGAMRENSSRNDEQTIRSQYGRVYQEASHQHETPADDIVVNEQQNGDRESPVLGSQSSLSVSSPPSSPPHVSHDEMDVSGDSPALPTSADGDRTVMSDNDQVTSTIDAANISRITTSSTVSRMEDDGWSSEHNEGRRKQDEYDEEGDSYQEDEIIDADDENLDLDGEFAGEQNTPVEMEPVILGFDEGVQVEIPLNSEPESFSMKSTERAIGVHSGSVEQELGSSPIGPSELVTEAEKALQDLTLSQINTLTDQTNGEPSGSATVSSSKLPHASSTNPVLSSASAAISQSHVPANLQFGLFSGPSLIPTPVPAIQIGSIQMPIHLNNQINSSLAQMHPSPAPLFQFGQLRYVRPIAQNVRSDSQAIPSIHAPAPTPYALNQNQNASSDRSNEMNREAQQSIQKEVASSSFNDKSVLPAAKLPLLMEHSSFQQLNASANNLLDRASVGENTTLGVSKAESWENHDLSMKRNNKPTSRNRDYSDGKSLSGPKVPVAVSGGRGRRYGYVVREQNMRSTGSVEPSHRDSRVQRRSRRNIKRTEFRVRETTEKNQNQAPEPLDHGEQNEKMFFSGTARDNSVRNMNRREGDKSFRTNEASDIAGGPSSTSASYYSKTERSTQKASSYERSHGGNKKSRASAFPEGDASTPLQAGVVRVVKQQGIEVPVDADGFIEVRSKKQIMSVRREQREKENRSKMRMAKAPRKQHQVSLHSSSSPSLNKGAVLFSGEPGKKVPLDSVDAIEGRVPGHVEPSVVLKDDPASMTPIGPPSANTESHRNYYAKKPIQSQATSNLVTSSAAAKLVDGLAEGNSKASSISTPFNMGTWDSSQINQQVMPLTQTQLEDAMKPGKFEQAASGFPMESNNSLSSTITTEKAYTSSASPINSLLAGEKIQFGAVTSPTVLPPISRTVSSGLGAPGSSRPDMKIDRSLPGDNAVFDKEKTSTKESCPNSEDVKAEAEAEAAASAVAVAAISNDEVVGSATDATATSAADNKSFSNKDLTGIASAGAITGQTGRSSTEEPLTVALPADLSVDTPSMSLWPSMPSPQASGQMVSQFPGAQQSHFSCFEMNTMLGGHIFAFGPSDESAGSQIQQPQRSNGLPSAPLGAWPQCHSGMDPFYRPPTGFAGPFISPGGIPGVQGPPHMVVYNHFAPVGQFGQMGLGFMGATYIPGDKQTDWKQNQGPAAVGVNQSDPNNQNMVPGQVTSPSVPNQVQHLRPTSIMPIPSPLTMFDMAPFQSSADIQMQPCWPHMPVPPLHSVPLSVPLQQHPIEGAAPPQFVHNVPMDNKASSNNRFQESSTSAAPSDNNKTFPSTAASQFTDEIGLVEQPASSSSNAQNVQLSFVRAGVISNEVPNSAKVMVRTNPPNANPGIATGVTSNPNVGQVTNMPSKPHQSSSSSDQQFQHADRRGRVTQKTGTVNEWHRRSGYPGRNQSSGSDKNTGTGRMKQIYVAKSSSTSARAPSG